MESILDAINEWIKEILIGAINGNLSTMFGDVNEKVGTIAAEVGQTPQGWNANIFSMIQTLVIALGAGLGIWGVINLLEGYGNDNPGAKSQGIKQLMAGGGVALIGTILVPLLSGLFG